MTRFLGLGYSVRNFLEKLGVSEWKAFQQEIKINNFMDWLHRHPITILMITYPPEIVNQGWKQCSAAFDDVKFTKETGIWRKTIIFTVNAKVET